MQPMAASEAPPPQTVLLQFALVEMMGDAIEDRLLSLFSAADFQDTENKKPEGRGIRMEWTGPAPDGA